MSDALQLFLAWRDWINVAGLGLDFAGVLLLASEWRIAISAERREWEIESRAERMRPPAGFGGPASPGMEVHRDMMERMEERRRLNRLAADRAARRARFTPALVIIALGFLLQIVASAPVG